MRFRSTGLGQTELKGRISKMSPAGDDLLVLHIKTHDPVEWHLRAAIERKDIPKILMGILKPSILFHVVKAFFYTKKNPREPIDIMDKAI